MVGERSVKIPMGAPIYLCITAPPRRVAHSDVMPKRVKSPRARALPAQALVSVVDDDESVRESLPDLLRELGFAARAFGSADEFLTSDSLSATRCLILDIAMPGMTGPQLQQELTVRGHGMAIIFITARADEKVRQQLIARGAVACLLKPFSEQELKTALDAALPARPAR